MPLIIYHPTRGLFTTCIGEKPSFSKRPNAAFTFYPDHSTANEELSHWTPHIAEACSLYNTERDIESIRDLLAYCARQPHRPRWYPKRRPQRLATAQLAPDGREKVDKI